MALRIANWTIDYVSQLHFILFCIFFHAALVEVDVLKYAIREILRYFEFFFLWLDDVLAEEAEGRDAELIQELLECHILIDANCPNHDLEYFFARFVDDFRWKISRNEAFFVIYEVVEVFSHDIILIMRPGIMIKWHVFLWIHPANFVEMIDFAVLLLVITQVVQTLPLRLIHLFLSVPLVLLLVFRVQCFLL